MSFCIFFSFITFSHQNFVFYLDSFETQVSVICSRETLTVSDCLYCCNL